MFQIKDLGIVRIAILHLTPQPPREIIIDNEAVPLTWNLTASATHNAEHILKTIKDEVAPDPFLVAKSFRHAKQKTSLEDLIKFTIPNSQVPMLHARAQERYAKKKRKHLRKKAKPVWEDLLTTLFLRAYSITHDIVFREKNDTLISSLSMARNISIAPLNRVYL
jgi:hypothetical protein